MINLKSLIVNILIPLAVGGLSTVFGNAIHGFDGINKPGITPPEILFPIVWSILYLLMGISSYLIYNSSASKEVKKSAFTFYAIQLILNGLWTLVFFRFKLFFLAFIWVLVIILFLAITIYKFYKIKPIAGYLQIPYLLWLIFASILSYNVFLIN